MFYAFVFLGIVNFALIVVNEDEIVFSYLVKKTQYKI